MEKRSLTNIATIALTVALAFGPALSVGAQTSGTADLQGQVRSLQSQVDALMSAIKAKIGGGTATPGGSVGNGQMAAACEIKSDLEEGAQGEEVSCLQRALIAQRLLSDDSGTGYFGPKTREALKRWQAANGVRATGYFGPISRGRFLMATGANPTVKLVIHRDTVDGWNLEVQTTNFKILAPDESGMMMGGVGAGHVHVYGDGVKIGRMYGNWQHVPGSVRRFISGGSHQVQVMLVDMNHQPIMVNGSPVQDTQTVSI